MSSTIYLYVKTHNITGLKYLGMTRKNPETYNGSGKYWLKHIKKHGKNISTSVLFSTNDPELFKRVGLYYSEKFNVVKSNEWANLMEEQGDGGNTSEHIDYKNRKDNSGEKNPFYGKTHTEEWKKTHSKRMTGLLVGEKNPFYGKTHTEEFKQMMRNKRGQKVTDGKEIFLSFEQAAGIYGVSRPTIANWCKSKDNWKRL